MNDKVPLTRLFAEVATGSIPIELDETAIRTAERAFVDTMAVAYAAANEETVHRLESSLSSQMVNGMAATVTGRTASARTAALVNGTAAHVLDYDDTADGMKGHPSAVLVPAILAVADEISSTGSAMLKAFCIGFQIDIAVGAGVDIKPHYQHGWHSTSSVGILGAAAAVASLRHIDVQTTRNALGIAASMASGSLQNFGTMTKSLHAGLTASNAIIAVDLAMAGITADESQLEGEYGYFAMYGVNANLELARNVLLGGPSLSQRGLNIKRYPSCSTPHPAVDVLIGLSDSLDPNSIEAIDITLQPHGLDPLVSHRPTNGLQAKFSLEYVAAASLLDRHLSLASFTDAAVQRPEVQDLLRRVHVDEAERPPVGPPEWDWIYTAMNIHTRSGEVRGVRRDLPRGHASIPLTDAELEQKVQECLAYGGSPVGADRLIERLWNLRQETAERDPLVPALDHSLKRIETTDEL